MEGRDTAGRIEIWEGCFQMIAERPILGWNPLDNRLVLGAMGWGHMRDAHNAFLWVWTAHGLVGLIPFVAVFAACAVTARRHRKGIHGIAPLAVLTLVVAMNMGVGFDKIKEHWFLMAYAGSAGAIGLTGNMVVRQFRRPGTSRLSSNREAAGEDPRGSGELSRRFARVVHEGRWPGRSGSPG